MKRLKFSLSKCFHPLGAIVPHTNTSNSCWDPFLSFHFPPLGNFGKIFSIGNSENSETFFQFVGKYLAWKILTFLSEQTKSPLPGTLGQKK